MTYYIFKTDLDKFLVSKITEHNDTVVSNIIATCESLDEAQKLVEDAVPANSIAVGDNIQGFDPLLQRKKRRKELLRRLAPMLRT